MLEAGYPGGGSCCTPCSPQLRIIDRKSNLRNALLSHDCLAYPDVFNANEQARPLCYQLLPTLSALLKSMRFDLWPISTRAWILCTCGRRLATGKPTIHFTTRFLRQKRLTHASRHLLRLVLPVYLCSGHRRPERPPGVKSIPFNFGPGLQDILLTLDLSCLSALTTSFAFGCSSCMPSVPPLLPLPTLAPLYPRT